MFLDVDSIKIKKKNGSYISLGNYLNQNPKRCLITEAKYQYNKLWSSDSGRNLAGKQSGTLIGIFPKITIQFGRLTQSELEAITPIIDSPRQIVKYYDPKKKRNVEMETYTNDWEMTNRGIVESSAKRNYKNEPFSVSFIAVEKR